MEIILIVFCIFARSRPIRRRIYARAQDSRVGTSSELSVSISDSAWERELDFSRLVRMRDFVIEWMSFCPDCRIKVALSAEVTLSISDSVTISIIGRIYAAYVFVVVSRILD